MSASGKNEVDIWAGGGLVYRKQKGNLEILLVHRPSYGDWSFPKGKQDSGEKLKETALREVREETGYHCRTKGRIGQVHYRVTRASLDALNDLLAQGLALNAARSVMRRFHARDQLPPSDLHREQMD